MNQTEPDVWVVLGCIALGLTALLLAAGCAGWALCRRSMWKRAERIFIVNAEGQRKTALVLEEQC